MSKSNYIQLFDLFLYSSNAMIRRIVFVALAAREGRELSDCVNEAKGVLRFTGPPRQH